jgi:hypothetical protein
MATAGGRKVLAREFSALKGDIAEAARAAHRKLDAQSTGNNQV